MKKYKNVGVYTICRIDTKGDIDAFRHIAKDVGVFAKNDSWENYEMYIDEVSIGTVCDRANLKKLINDALSGKIDLIYIGSIWDLWHNPQHFVETANVLRSFETPIGIILPKGITPHCPVMLNSLDDEDFTRMVYEVLELQKADIDLMFLAANKDNISKETLLEIFAHRIDHDMLYNFFVDFILGARDLDWLDLKTEIGFSDDDMRFLQLAFHPTNEGMKKIIEWDLNDILAYYLA